MNNSAEGLSGSGGVAAEGRMAVLFSGGRDSTLAAISGFERRKFLHLLSFESGLGYGGAPLRQIRLSELEKLWGSDAFSAHTIPIHGSVRKICFVDLVDDIVEDRRQLILLGEFIAMLAAAVSFCVRRGITDLATGAASYQSYFPEQQPRSIELFKEMCGRYSIELHTPVWDYRSELSVKDRLLSMGVISKSLEGATLLADIDDSPPSEVVESYLLRKQGLFDSIVRLALGSDFGRK